MGAATTGTGEALPRARMPGQLSRRCASWRDREFGSWLVLMDPRDLFERLAVDRVYVGVDPANVKSLRALAKLPGVRQVDDELYELTAGALTP